MLLTVVAHKNVVAQRIYLSDYLKAEPLLSECFRAPIEVCRGYSKQKLKIDRRAHCDLSRRNVQEICHSTSNAVDWKCRLADSEGTTAQR